MVAFHGLRAAPWSRVWPSVWQIESRHPRGFGVFHLQGTARTKPLREHLVALVCGSHGVALCGGEVRIFGVRQVSETRTRRVFPGERHCAQKQRRVYIGPPSLQLHCLAVLPAHHAPNLVSGRWRAPNTGNPARNTRHGRHLVTSQHGSLDTARRSD